MVRCICYLSKIYLLVCFDDYFALWLAVLTYTQLQIKRHEKSANNNISLYIVWSTTIVVFTSLQCGYVSLCRSNETEF